jgi:hypothetical protein
MLVNCFTVMLTVLGNGEEIESLLAKNARYSGKRELFLHGEALAALEQIEIHYYELTSWYFKLRSHSSTI